MAKKLSDNAKAVFYAVKAAQDEGKAITLAGISEATGLSTRSVNGVIVGAFGERKSKTTGEVVKKAVMAREEVQVEDGTKVKIIKIVDPTFDPEAVPEDEE
jgi:hypothetical protein